MKHCGHCHADTPLTEFHRNAATNDGLQAWCRNCMGEFVRSGSARHGIDELLWSAYFTGRCDLCGAYASGTKHGWSIDHDHDHCAGPTGCIECVRGVLCQQCNIMEGHVASAQERGLITEVLGPLRDYLRNGGPFQRFRGISSVSFESLREIDLT